MKSVLFIFLVFFTTFMFGQSLPIDFETDIQTTDFVDFDGGKATVIENPLKNASNPSEKVAQIIRTGGQIWAGSKLVLKDNLNFSQNSIISMKIFTTAPKGTVIKFKLEGMGTSERDIVTKLSNQWETVTWDFTGTPTNYNNIVFMFDFGKVGDGTATSTFLFDDVKQIYGGKQIDLPVNFEGSVINYMTTDFGGNSSSLVLDPTDASNHVIKVIKAGGAATWAGTTIGTPAGFATRIPLDLTNSNMNVRVWSPMAGIAVRLKVEDHKDPTHTCETQSYTTKSKEWETINFDFKNQATGTELLSIGVERNWIFDMASIFFNFGKEILSGQDEIYYFDDVKFGTAVSNIVDIDEGNDIIVFPNPSGSFWTIKSEKAIIYKMALYDINGRLLLENIINDNTYQIESNNYLNGTYILKLTSDRGNFNMKLLK